MTVVPLYKEKVAFLKRDNLVRSILLFQFIWNKTGAIVVVIVW